jgi:hypothetical protein
MAVNNLPVKSARLGTQVKWDCAIRERLKMLDDFGE